MNVVGTCNGRKVSDHYDEVAEVYDHRYDANRGKFYYNHISRHVMERFPKGAGFLTSGAGQGSLSAIT